MAEDNISAEIDKRTRQAMEVLVQVNPESLAKYSLAQQKAMDRVNAGEAPLSPTRAVFLLKQKIV